MNRIGLAASLAITACTGTTEPLLVSTQEAPGLTGDAIAISAGTEHSCALHRDGSIACWGWNGDEWGWAMTEAPYGSFVSLSTRGTHSCARRIDDTIACWGSNDYGEATAPLGRFRDVVAGTNHQSCAIHLDGTVTCWGREWLGQTLAPAGAFVAISAGGGIGCGLRASGAIECWGEGNVVAPPAGSFVQLSVEHESSSCALREDGSVVCWGTNAFPGTPPADRFVYVSHRGSTSMGIREDGSLASWVWGSLPADHALPPGRFVALARGYNHTCAIRDGGEVVCWGANFSGQSTPPAAGRDDT